MNGRPPYLLDYRFQKLQRVAAGRGGLDHAQQFARGVRSVLDQIEATGHFRPNPLLAYLIDLHALPQFAAAPHDAAGFTAARAFLAKAGWTAEQGYDFARGARLAESELSDYRAPDPNDTAAAA